MRHDRFTSIFRSAGFSPAFHHPGTASPSSRWSLQSMNANKWIRRFEKNATNRREPDWGAPVELQGSALRKLCKSLQQFQLGDGGGPASLIGWNREDYLSGEPQMRQLIDLWFNEEKEHSRLLGAALKRFEVPQINGHWSFSLFCGMRRFLGVRFELEALLLTEIVSHVYYKMLHHHVGDPAVRGMCALIIRDESGHIAFHRARLAGEIGGDGRQAVLGRAWLFRLRGLMAGTVLWVNHRGALRELGAGDAEFYQGIWKGMNRFINGLRREDPRRQALSQTTHPPDRMPVSECSQFSSVLSHGGGSLDG